MPYIITTNTPTYETWDGVRLAVPNITCRAVAALDEARNAVAATALPSTPYVDICAAITLRNGGTIGPLPDGTVIEVESVEWVDLLENLTNTQIINAYNNKETA